MKLKYVGPSPEVQLAATGQTIKRGVAVEVDDTLAEGLLLQGHEVETGTPVDPVWVKPKTKDEE